MAKLDEAFKKIKSNKELYISELNKLISYKTVSAYRESKDEFIQAAKFLEELLKKAGIENVQLLTDYGNPIVYAEKIMNKDFPTILFYGHYDVQPAEPLDLWRTDPYVLNLKSDRLYGRGVADDKTLCFSIIKTLELINNLNFELKYNVKIIFECSEETDSRELNEILNDKNHNFNFYKDLFSASTLLACDVSMSSETHPSLTLGCRGCVTFDLILSGPNRDIHSGQFGGFIGNPIHEISRLIASFHDENNHIAINNFYDGVNTTDFKKSIINKTPFSETFYQEDLGVNGFDNEVGFTTLQSARIRPTIEVNGIFGGHIKEGGKTIIPAYVTAKISSRLVDNQNPDRIIELFEKHISENINKGFKFKIVENGEGSKAVTVNTDNKEFKNIEKAFIEEYGEVPTQIFTGGSLPILSKMQEVLGCDIVFVGFGGPTSNSHGPNENYAMSSFEKGIKTLLRYLTRS